MKKLISLTLALVLALSLCATAFAADVDETDENGAYTSGELTATGQLSLPTIRVSFPDAMDIFVNPYGMSVDPDGDDGAAEAVNDQIVTPNYQIINYSTVPVVLSATVTGVIDEGSEAVFASAAPAATDTKKSVYMYLNTMVADDTPEWAAKINTKTDIVVAAKAAKLDSFMTLAQSADGNTVGEGGTGWYRFTGSVATKPTDAWTAEDTVSATVAFTFVPSTYVAE